MKKYEIVDGRVKALIDFSDASAWEITGGRIASERNLSQWGDCWIYGDAKVFGNAKVLGETAKEDNQIIEIEVSDELRLKLIKSWISSNLTPESASVYEDTGDLEQAIFNEAVIDVLKEQMEKST